MNTLNPSDGSQYDKPFVLEEMSEEAAIAFGIIIILGFFYGIQVFFMLRIGKAASAKSSELKRRHRNVSSIAEDDDMPLINLNRTDHNQHSLLNSHVATKQKNRLRAKTIIEAMKEITKADEMKSEQLKEEQMKDKTAVSQLQTIHEVPQTVASEQDQQNIASESEAFDEELPFAEQIQRLRSMTTTSMASVGSIDLSQNAGDLSTLMETEMETDPDPQSTHNPLHFVGIETPSTTELYQEILTLAPTNEDIEQQEELLEEVRSPTPEEDKDFLIVLERVSGEKGPELGADTPPPSTLSSAHTSEISLPNLVLEQIQVEHDSIPSKPRRVQKKKTGRSASTRTRSTTSLLQLQQLQTPTHSPLHSAVMQSLVESPSLASRKQTRQQIIIRGLRALKAGSSSTGRLMHLSLSDLNMTDSIAKLIAAALRTNATITSLDLSHNRIEALGCTEIAHALGRLSEATLVAAGLVGSSRGLTRSTGSTSSNGSLASVSSSIAAGSPRVCVSPPKMSYNTTLTLLDLRGNAVGSKGANALAEALRFNSTLEYLDLSFQSKGKKIGSDGCTALATLLHLKRKDGTDLSSLKTLRLARSNISFEGCRHLASAILSNSTLTELDIGHINYIGISGAMQLGQAIACSPHTRLAWLTVGSHRLPVSVLLGDQRLYHAMQAVIRSERAVAERTPLPEVKSSTIQHRPPVQTGKQKVLLAAAEKILHRAELALDAAKEASIGNQYPKSLTISKIENEAYLLSSHKAFMEMSSHGMDDEMAVVVAALLKRNRTLEFLTLEEALLPIQQLQGFASPPTRRLDLSYRHMMNADAIIVGSLVADNKVLRILNLRGNQFQSTEGENFIAYALEKNTRLKLDLVNWPKERMYYDGYLSLASVQGMSASGAKIEPQRLEGWFYRSITAVAGLQYYFNLAADIVTIHIFAASPETYRREYVDIASLLLCTPTILYCYNSMRNALGVDLRAGLFECALAVLQITPGLQAWECVVLACETTAYLDYKFIQGLYKQVPWICLKTYILLEVAVNKGVYDIWVLISMLASLLSITMIFIMLYDRKDARRLSYLPVAIQPRLARLVADLFTCCGMGRDTSLVKNFVNFDSYYTAHYCISYVYQIAGLGARALSLAWITATADPTYIPMLLFMIFVVRCTVVCLHDPNTFKRTLYNNLVHILSLCVTDSAWSKDADVQGDQDPVVTRACYVGLALLSTFENAAAALYAAFLHPRGTRISHMTNEGLFAVCVIFMVVRWFLMFHWAVVVHFPQLYTRALKQVPKVGTKATPTACLKQVSRNKAVKSTNPVKSGARAGAVKAKHQKKPDQRKKQLPRPSK